MPSTLPYASAAALVALALLSAAGPTPAQPSPGQTQLRLGAQLYTQHCVLCHGAEGRGGQVFPRPIWGPGHDLAKFGNAKGLFEYMQLLMPFDDPSKIDDAGKLALTAFMLSRNGGWAAEQPLTAASAGSVTIR